MILAEEFDSGTWGSWRKAIAARSKRVKELEEQGYEVDTATRYYGLRAENRGYRLFAHLPGEMTMKVAGSPNELEDRLNARMDALGDAIKNMGRRRSTHDHE